MLIILVNNRSSTRKKKLNARASIIRSTEKL